MKMKTLSIISQFLFLFFSLALITWNILAYVIAYKQYLELQKLTIPMILCCLLHTIYIVHYFLDETVVLNMVDFTSEHFGWMLIFGNIVLYVALSPDQFEIFW
jgi:hypothetical protein